MIRPRVIPSLLMSNHDLVKTVNFNNPNYIGDPINTVKIFNEKMVDEIILYDISAAYENRGPDFKFLEKIFSELFIPVCYGGGITTLGDVKRLFKLGIEKISLSSSVLDSPALIRSTSDLVGAQSVAVTINVKKNIFGKYKVYNSKLKKITTIDPFEFASEAEAFGAGEICVYSVDKDGTMSGYDLTIIHEMSQRLSVPIVACGGACEISDFKQAIEAGASAVAAASMFVYIGIHKAVLINFPNEEQLKDFYRNFKSG